MSCRLFQGRHCGCAPPPDLFVTSLFLRTTSTVLAMATDAMSEAATGTSRGPAPSEPPLETDPIMSLCEVSRHAR